MVATAVRTTQKRGVKSKCEQGRWIIGICDHFTKRYRYVPCGRRDCPVCGTVGRYRIAERIALGIREFWPCAWLVLTFEKDVSKKEAVKRLNSYVKWLRKPERQGPHMQYAATYELTQRGRIHINLIAGPWHCVDFKELKERWGARISVELVQDMESMGKEAAKAYSPESLGGYLSKLEQCVPDDRRASFSKGWPKLPKGGAKRKGNIKWKYLFPDDELKFKTEKLLNEWVPVVKGDPNCGEYKSWWGEECDCFEYEDDS